MGLYEDLQELSLLVPDAPNLPDRVLEEARKHAEAVAKVLVDSCQWAEEADALEGRLAVALTELRNRCAQGQEVVRAGTEAVTEVLRDLLKGLDKNEDALEESLAAAVTQFDEVAKDFTSFAQAVTAVGKASSTAVDDYSSKLDPQVSALQASAAAAARTAASLGTQVSAASSAAQDSAAQIAGRMERIGSAGLDHVVESVDAVKKHLGAVGDALDGVTGALRPALQEMAGTATATEEKAAALGTELAAVMTAAREAVETLEPAEPWFSAEITSLATNGEALQARRAELTTLVENARAGAAHVGQGR